MRASASLQRRVVYMNLADKSCGPLSGRLRGIASDGHQPSHPVFTASFGSRQRLVSTMTPHDCTMLMLANPATALAAAATAAPGTVTPHAASRPDPSSQPPPPVYTAATASLSHCPWSAQAQPEASASWHAAGKSCDSPGTAPAAAVRRPRHSVVTRRPTAPPADGCPS